MRNRRADGHWYEDPKLLKEMEGKRYIDYCMVCLLVTFMRDVDLKMTCVELMNGRGGEITWGEFVCFIGI